MDQKHSLEEHNRKKYARMRSFFITRILTLKERDDR